MSLAHVIHRLVTDETFQRHWAADPRAALAAARLDLTDQELQALGSVLCNDPLLILAEPYPPLSPNNPGWWTCQFNRCLTLLGPSTPV